MRISSLVGISGAETYMADIRIDPYKSEMVLIIFLILNILIAVDSVQSPPALFEVFIKKYSK